MWGWVLLAGPSPWLHPAWSNSAQLSDDFPRHHHVRMCSPACSCSPPSSRTKSTPLALASEASNLFPPNTSAAFSFAVTLHTHSIEPKPGFSGFIGAYLFLSSPRAPCPWHFSPTFPRHIFPLFRAYLVFKVQLKSDLLGGGGWVSTTGAFWADSFLDVHHHLQPPARF